MLLLSVLIFYSFLILPFWGLLPYLDGSNEFMIAHNFFQGNYLSNWQQYHPPLKPFISSIVFKLLGLDAYVLVGYILGVLGIISIYFIGLYMFNKKTAVLSSLMLAASGLYISTSLFSLNDFIMTVFILLGFVFYLKKRIWLYTLFIMLAVMAKETAIVFPLAVLFIDWKRKIRHIAFYLPFGLLFLWMILIHLGGHHLWNEWNFSETKDKGSAYTLIYNVLKGGMFNKYAYENWLHLLIFNYNWFFWIMAVPAFWKNRKKENVVLLVLFVLFYALIMLSFQTFTITRYILPILPFVYILAAEQACNSRYYYVFVPLIFLFSGISLFSSTDPLSNAIWKKKQVLGTWFYTHKLDGKDGITYNYQFLLITRKRNEILLSPDCFSRRRGLEVSPKLIKIFKLTSCDPVKKI